MYLYIRQSDPRRRICWFQMRLQLVIVWKLILIPLVWISDFDVRVARNEWKTISE